MQKAIKRIETFFYLNKTQAELTSLLKRGYAIALFISMCSVLLLSVLFLMQLGNIPLLSLHYVHVLFVVGAFVLLFWMHYLPFAWAAFLALFVCDKALLLYSGLLTPLVGLPIVAILALFLFQALRAALTVKVSAPDAPLLKSMLYARNKDAVQKNPSFFDAVLCVALLLVLAVIVEKCVGWVNASFMQWNQHALLFLQGIVTLCAFLLVQGRELRFLLGRLYLAVVNILAISLATLLSTFIAQHRTTPYQNLDAYQKKFGNYLSEVFFF